ncbi:lipid A biosynthesis lauroyl acyltransferase [Aquaspirillum sp. LM1]|uniref:lipid A biosynthesis lauroyl acyltransferase n=1 Tax=Aquaspirillum sp. LM1 TaxID=1938604 RepID=UPI000983E41E|nr:lipid A biosynthesis lauroyl acyltransferase [Aquaspirillum sp. LM1]AQR66820.1 lipid A biosynthesis lauroyl acyltransferase [Aquaspirillum sp. LM1]
MRLAIAVLWMLHWMPVPVLAVLGRVLGTLGYLLARERRRVGLINLRLCFPQLSPLARRQIILRHCQHLVQSILEYGVVWWASPTRLRRLVTLKNVHYLHEQAQHNTIVLYPHFVAFELCALRLNLDQRLVSVYSNQKNPVLNAQIYQGRNRFDNAKIVSRQEGLRSIIKAMRDHTPFLYLPDQDFGPRDSVFVKFFAEDAATITGLSRIAGLAKAKVVPAVARRVGFRYELEFFPAWENFPSDDLEADTRRMNAFIEQQVLEQPEQYFWLHKRFKTRPQGQPRFY